MGCCKSGIGGGDGGVNLELVLELEFGVKFMLFVDNISDSF